MALLAPTARAQAAPRILSLDQCADQYVLALAPRSSIVGLSTKADDADSLLRERSRGLPLRRVDLETALAARPEIVVRTYGGDPRLLAQLERRGVRVLTLVDADDFTGVRREIRAAAAAFGAGPAGEALVTQMDAKLARAAGAWRGRAALYLTPGGFTAGPQTLPDAVMRAAGLINMSPEPGYSAAPLEALTLKPPAAVVLGFFDTQMYAAESWAPARQSALRRLLAERSVASLPGRWIGCATWAAADAALLLASRAPR